MLKRIFASLSLLIAALVLISAFASLPSFADMDRGHNGFGRSGPRYYHSHDGRWYRPGWFGFRLYAPVPPIGAYVDVLPDGYSMVVVGGRRFFYYSNVYYSSADVGYVVVQPPVVQQTVTVTEQKTPIEPTATEVQTTTPGSQIIYVPNSNGSYTPVKLVKKGSGYVGPQGEFYPTNPTVEQLRVLYGK